MLDQQLRDVKETIMVPIAEQVGARTHPNTVSLIGLGVGIAAGVAAWQGAYLLGLGLWGINRLLDGLDGTLARRYKKQSALGGYIDIMLDFVVYAFIPVMMAVGQNSTPVFLAALFLLATFYVNAASFLALSAVLERRNLGAVQRGEKTTFTMPAGMVEGTETIAFFVAFFLFPGHLTLLFTLMGIALVYTIGQRMAWAVREL